MSIKVVPGDTVHFEKIKTYLDVSCGSSQDFAIVEDPDGERTGKFDCPVIGKEVTIKNGVCQETRRTCKEHR